jgi:hypothetical protein
MGGLIFLLAYVAVLVWLCVRSDKKVKAEMAVTGRT